MNIGFSRVKKKTKKLRNKKMRSMIKREYKHSLEKQAFFSNFNNIIHFPDRVG